MYLTTLDPISRDFDRIVRRAFGGAVNHGGLSYAPALPMDTVRRDGEVVLRFDVPGVDQDKIDVTVDKGVHGRPAGRRHRWPLTISAGR
jgi:HSP20 family protein